MSAFSPEDNNPWPPLKKQRFNHGPPDFDSVKDEISYEELQGLSEYERAREIVAWANWWFRPQWFCPEYLDYESWENAIKHAVPMPVDRVRHSGRPELSPTEEQILERVKEMYVHHMIEHGGELIRPELRPSAQDFLDGYNYYRGKWLGSYHQLGLERVLTTAKIPFVNKIVAFGTGSPAWTNIALRADLDPTNFGPSHGIRQLHQRRFTQYAILMWMAEFFRIQHGQPVEVYVQDPDLKATDEEAMERLGFIIMDGQYDYQQGFAMIDNNTLVYDAIIARSIYQIFMQYSYPAAVMTSPIYAAGDYSNLQDEDKFVILQHPDVEDGVPFLWPQPLHPAGPTKKAFGLMKNYYDEVSLLDEQKIPEERRRNMTQEDIYTELWGQVSQDISDYYKYLQEQADAEKAKLMAQGSFDELAHRNWTAQLRMRTECEQPPPDLNDIGFSGQNAHCLPGPNTLLVEDFGDPTLNQAGSPTRRENL
ncbi:hypothetical protein VMCG_02387 [Cytospora schulzeri]|uniref:SRR1-like domain-containing protein n=1 Tax=Cytospora schulzeri TaxID=448051 RepID=A0A423X1K8_9PEZI|nr:hypothetical protein VMCG_02387 [Valsa malicola]